jgi:hypothetical protein
MLFNLRMLAVLFCIGSLAACGGGSGSTSAASAGTSSALAPSVSTLAFSPAQPTGTASSFQTITLTNNASSALTLSSLTVTGANAAAFATSNDCPTSLAASATCTVWVTFGPTAAAPAVGSLSIASSAPDSPTVVALTGTGIAPATAVNVVPLTVDSGPIGLLSAGRYQQNLPFASVTLCTPGSTTNCQVIDHVLLDTSSTGLRIIAQVLAPGGAVPTPLTIGGNALRECLNYGSGYTWGSMATADVILGGSTVASLPVSLIGDSAAGAAPADCAVSGNNLGYVAALGVNGVLGINGASSNYDCPACSVVAQPTSYYSCPSAGACAPIAAPLSSQAANPVAFLPSDNNGAIVTLGSPLATGSASLTGALVLGINTEANNALGNAQLLPVSGSGAFTTSFEGTVFTSYLSSTAQANYFYSASLTPCADYTGYYCPSGATPEVATLISAGSVTSAAVSFTVDNADIDFSNYKFAALPGLAGVQPSSASPFVWGLPFFYGHPVYLLFGGQSTAGVAGPAIGF